IEASERAPELVDGIVVNLKDGFKMAMSILPTILSIGLIGLLLANFTPVFDAIAWIYYPFTLLVRIPEPFLAAKALATEIAEMFLPSLIVVDAPLLTRFFAGVVSISQLLFFSASIPCILSTAIPVSIPQILLVWVERTIFSILIASLFIFLLL
ncbi:MAG: YjiH family protein, partial [Candidatus Thermoplasmatota archaeon]|nr:YjiH family protein [Candidatus Thermoplasmatota archaeon]